MVKGEGASQAAAESVCVEVASSLPLLIAISAALAAACSQHSL